jgi:predicted metal-binding membrane protein
VAFGPWFFLPLAAATAWTGVALMDRQMRPMTGTMGLSFGIFIAVWTLMMCAMMLPSVTPFASLYVRTLRVRRISRLLALTTGYVVAWASVGAPAYVLAWVAGRSLDAHTVTARGYAVAIFFACGIYQLTPLKDRCLAKCRSPLGWVARASSYEGRLSDFRAGLGHGAFCVGCCWGLMVLLVAFGLMNLVAMVALAAVVLVEKTSRFGYRFSKVVGVASLALAVCAAFYPRLAPGLVPAQPPPNMSRMS